MSIIAAFKLDLRMKKTTSEPDSFAKWFLAQQEALKINVKEIHLTDAHDWKLMKKDDTDSYIGHVSGKYHRGVFLKAWDSIRNDWIERFMLAPIPPEKGEELYGVALLARYDGKYLVQAKSEPGNATPNHVQLTTTIQASYTNIEMQLSGVISYTWMYKDPRCVHFIVSQDGAQLYMKRNKVCFIDLTQDPEIVSDNFTWATIDDIRSFAAEGLASEHLLQCLGASILM